MSTAPDRTRPENDEPWLGRILLLKSTEHATLETSFAELGGLLNTGLGLHRRKRDERLHEQK